MSLAYGYFLIIDKIQCQVKSIAVNNTQPTEIIDNNFTDDEKVESMFTKIDVLKSVMPDEYKQTFASVCLLIFTAIIFQI